MTYYATCFNCAVDKAACARRIALQKALAGSNVTSVKFRCHDRQAYFRSGQRVSFDWKIWEEGGYDESCMRVTFHGTVLRENGSKFVVQVDPGKDHTVEGYEASEVFKRNDALIIKVRPDDMMPLPEPDRAVCTCCYQIEGMAEIRCHRTNSSDDWKPKGCITPDSGPFRKDDEYPW